MIYLFSLLVAWAMAGDTLVRIPEEVVYGIICGLFLLFQISISTREIGGK